MEAEARGQVWGAAAVAAAAALGAPLASRHQNGIGWVEHGYVGRLGSMGFLTLWVVRGQGSILGQRACEDM